MEEMTEILGPKDLTFDEMGNPHVHSLKGSPMKILVEEEPHNYEEGKEATSHMYPKG